MASPKSVKDLSPVAPAAPAACQPADDAQPGEVSKYKKDPPANAAKTGKPDPTKRSWIEVELVGEDGKGIPGEAFRVIADDGTVFGGTTNEKGIGRVAGIEPGSYDITFPRLDHEAWEPA
jgi:type VI secretion system secreted protein VgrG